MNETTYENELKALLEYIWNESESDQKAAKKIKNIKAYADMLGRLIVEGKIK